LVQLAKRFWTQDLYCFSPIPGKWQALWMKEEPPSIYGGQCQLTIPHKRGFWKDILRTTLREEGDNLRREKGQVK